MEEHKPENGPVSRRGLLAAGGAAGLGLLATSCRGSTQTEDNGGGGGGGAGNFPNTREYNFVFINHVTTNPFFTPTRYGIEDASALLGTTYQWTGSKDSVASEMVNAMNTAINGNADGIAVSIVDPNAFNDPISRALDQGIPVVAYNANGASGEPNPALAYIGQELYDSGVQMGNRIVELVGSGPVALFISTPGQLNIQPRIEGAKDAIQQSGADIQASQVATGAELNEELNRIDAYYQGHKDVKGMFAVDGGSTQGVGQVMRKYGLHEQGVRGGGYDLLPKTLQTIKQGHLDFTIDQQPYLQGFQPVVQLYMYKLSGGLVVPTDANTSLKFVTQDNVDPYLQTKTRFQGSTEKQKVLEAPSEIQQPPAS